MVEIVVVEVVVVEVVVVVVVVVVVTNELEVDPNQLLTMEVVCDTSARMWTICHTFDWRTGNATGVWPSDGI